MRSQRQISREATRGVSATSAGVSRAGLFQGYEHGNGIESSLKARIPSAKSASVSPGIVFKETCTA